MNDLINEIANIAAACKKVANSFYSDVAGILRTIKCRSILKAIDSIKPAWSQSWIGYHACVYLTDFRAAESYEYFDQDLGLFEGRSVGEWREFKFDEVITEILSRASSDAADVNLFDQIVQEATATFNANKKELLYIFTIIVNQNQDIYIQEQLHKLKELSSHLAPSEIIARWQPASLRTRDKAAASKGLQLPPHIVLEAELLSKESYKDSLESLATFARDAEKYLRRLLQLQDMLKPAQTPVPTVDRVIANYSFYEGSNMGEKFNINSFQGVLNNRSHVDNLTQTISRLPPTVTDQAKQDLTKLVNNLVTALKGAPAEHQADADKVVKRVDDLVTVATEDDPDEETVKSRGVDLEKAAKKIGSVVPPVLDIVTQIIQFAHGLSAH